MRRYTTSDEEVEAAIADSANNARKGVAARLLRIEKGILNSTISHCPTPEFAFVKLDRPFQCSSSPFVYSLSDLLLEKGILNITMHTVRKVLRFLHWSWYASLHAASRPIFEVLKPFFADVQQYILYGTWLSAALAACPS